MARRGVTIPVKKLKNEKYRAQLSKKVNFDIPTFEKLEKMAKTLEQDIGNIYFRSRGWSPLVFDDGLIYVYLCAPEDGESLQLLKKHIKGLQESVHKLIVEKDFRSLFWFMLDKRVKYRVFSHLILDIPDDQKFDIFVGIYLESDFGLPSGCEGWIDVIFSYKDHSRYIEHLKELQQYADSDGYLTIYRGQCSKSISLNKAFSWTLNPEVAQFFANRFKWSKGNVYQAKIHIDDVVIYLPEHNEEELWVYPSAVKDIKRLKKIVPLVESGETA